MQTNEKQTDKIFSQHNFVQQLQGWNPTAPLPSPSWNASLTGMGLIFLAHCQHVPYLWIFPFSGSEVCFPGTIVTLMEASFTSNQSFQSVCLYSTFLLHIEVWWYTYCDLFTEGGRRLKLASHAWDHEQRCQRSILRRPRWPWEAIRGGCRALNWLPLH